jgi:hypothetical protein
MKWPPEDDTARPATGYLVRNWYALNPNQWMRDTVEHTGRLSSASLSIAHIVTITNTTPISQRDYFRFRAILLSPIQVRQDW